MFELTRRSPFGSMFQIHRELDDLVSRFLGRDVTPTPYQGETEPEPVTWWPAVESYSQDGNLHVRVALPGVDPKDVEVTVADDCLTVRGERKAKTGEKNGGRFVREFAYGAFERTFSLPEGIDPSKVQAKYTNGMLELTMPAPVAVVPKKVEIQIEDGTGRPKAIKAG
jgi:HSP20 family protein